ncbi:MAG: hypothetical protein WC733_02125 [Methylophilus sp.]|jgi:hypothetical protein
MALDLDKLAAQFGGSVDTGQSQPTGYSAVMDGLSPKDQAELRMNNYKDDRKRIAELDATITGAAPTLADLNKFIQLNQNESTGSLWNNITPNTPMLHSDNTNQMIAIQSRLGPSQRATGSGSSSDRDVSLFMGGLPSTDKGGNANSAIRDDFQRKYEYAVSKKAYLQDYLRKNGSLDGADESWNSTPQYKSYIGGGVAKQSAVSGGGWSARKVK